MKEVKFSEDYWKFGGNKLPFQATLLQCFKIDYNELSGEFIAYDTVYGQGMTYNLPKTDLIVLLFEKGSQMFTTIRRYTPEKWKYYKSQEGNIMRMVEG